MKAFYFAADDNKLRYGDGRSIEVGATHEVKGEAKLCQNGLHASVRLIDALGYAPGSNLYLVELGGGMDVGKYKVCATKRTYLKHLDASDLLRQFARNQALINIEEIKPYCSAADYDIIISYLTTGEGRSAAWSAAWSAARSARSVARSAAESAAESAAWSAAWSAAAESAWSAARSAWLVARSAAESAAKSAAWSAAESAANDMLTQMVKEATGWEI